MTISVTFQRKGKAKELLDAIDEFIKTDIFVIKLHKDEYDILMDAIIPGDKDWIEDFIPYGKAKIFKVERKKND